MAVRAPPSATGCSHLVLPALALGLVSSALITRFTRASMLDVLNDDYVRTARSKGMSEWRVVLKHAFKNALIPILTVIGLTAALLISGAVVTETVFGLPGVGNLVVSAVLRRDYPVIQGALLVIAGALRAGQFRASTCSISWSIRGCATDGRDLRPDRTPSRKILSGCWHGRPSCCRHRRPG